MRSEKQAMVAEIRENVAKGTYVILADCRGLKVEQFSALRGQLRQVEAKLQIVKNTFFTHATKDMGFPNLDDYLKGPTAIIVGTGEITLVAKAISNYVRDNNLPVVKGGVMGTRLLTAKDVEALASLPSREVMLSMFVGTVAAPMSQLVGVLNQKVCSLLYVLKAVEQKKAGSK